MSEVEPIRVAYVTSVYPRATDTFIRTEVTQLRRLGLDVRPFSVRKPTAKHFVNSEIRDEANRTGYLLDGGMLRLLTATCWQAITRPARFMRVVLLAWRTGMTGLAARVRQVAYVMEACVLADAMVRQRIKHLHNHIGENSATVAMLAAAMAGVPYSMTIHGPGIFFHPVQWALGQKIARSAFTVCITEFCKSQCMIFAPPSSWDRLKVVRCGIDERFLDAAQMPAPTEPRLVCVGRLCPEKGQVLLVQAAARLKEQGIGVYLTLVGDGEMRGEIEATAAQLGIADRVEITGWLNSEQVRERIQQARALVCASFAEGLPIVIMEALALGRPVIATRIAGIPELVENEVNGWLIPPSSIDALVDAMKMVVNASSEQLQRLGQAGAQCVRERHNAQTEAKKLAAHIRQAIKTSDNERAA